MVDNSNTINPQLLTLNTNVGQPYSHGRSGSDFVYMVSPDASASVGSHAFSWEDLETPISGIEDGSPESLRADFGPHSVKPLYAITQQQDMNTFQPQPSSQDVNLYLGQTYTPGFTEHRPSHSPHASITVTPAGETTEFIPVQDPSPYFTVQCKDFLQYGRPPVDVERDFDTWAEVTKLVEQVNNGSIIVRPARESGQRTGLSALQQALSAAFPRMPPTDEQLANLLRSTGAAVDNLSHSILSAVLEKYGALDGRQLQLGILYETKPNFYKATIYSQYGYTISTSSLTTIWLFYSPSELGTDLQGSWSAFVPPKFLPRRRISYAEAASSVHQLSPVNHQQSRYLELPPSSPSGRRPSSSPSRRGKGSRQQRLVPNNRRPPTPLQNPVEIPMIHSCKNCSKTFETQSELIHHRRKYSSNLTKNHSCSVCHKAFMYPKDLRRHESTHTGEKKHRCHICPKSFTRKDNLGRHIRDDHHVLTPFGSEAADF